MHRPERVWSLPVWLILLLFTAGPRARSETTATGDFSYARENPTLRTYFRSVLRGRQLHTYAPEQEVDGFRWDEERRIDQLIDRYAREISDQLAHLRSMLDTVRESQRKFESVPAGSSTYNPARIRVIHALKQLGQAAGSLRETLSFPLIQLRADSNYRPIFSEFSRAARFAPEIRFLAVQTLRAIDAAQNFVLGTGHTVEVQALQEGNVLIALQRVERLSTATARALSHLTPPPPSANPGKQDTADIPSREGEET